MRARRTWETLSEDERTERIWECVHSLGLEAIQIKEKVEGWKGTPEYGFVDTFLDINEDLDLSQEEIKSIGKGIFEKMKVV